VGRRKVITKDMMELFLKDFEDLGSVSKLSKKWGVSYATARSRLRDFGVDEIKKKGPDEYHPMLGRWSDSRIADELGVSKQAVFKARKARGIKSAMETALSMMNGE